MNTDLDTLKSRWQSLSQSTPSGMNAEETAKNICQGRVASRSGRICKIYRINVALCLIWIGMSGLFIRSPFGFPVWMVITMAAYFGIMALMSYLTLMQARAIDLGRMSVREALDAVCRLKKIRLIHKMIGFSLCVPLMVCLLAYFSQTSEVMLVGGATGAVLGLVIGLMIDQRVRLQIREINSELKSITKE